MWHRVKVVRKWRNWSGFYALINKKWVYNAIYLCFFTNVNYKVHRICRLENDYGEAVQDSFWPWHRCLILSDIRANIWGGDYRGGQTAILSNMRILSILLIILFAHVSFVQCRVTRTLFILTQQRHNAHKYGTQSSDMNQAGAGQGHK